jgi:signal transduction histidine kinase
MRSLFFKIFLWFWLAMILVAGAAVVSLRVYLDPEEEGMRALAANFRDPVAFMAVETFEESGQAALRQHLERWGRQSGFRGFVLDERGVEVSGQDLPAEVAEVARRARDTGQGAAQRAPEFIYIASHIPGANGKSYIFVAGLPNRPPRANRPPLPVPGGPSELLPPPPPPPPPPRGLAADRPPFPLGGPLGFVLTQPRILVLILAAVVLMSGVVCYGLARYLTGPLQRLRASARQLANGDLAVRVGGAVQNRRDEMGDLGRDFDFMAEQIESLVSSQRRLLRDMSHELRSPLARLNVAVGLVRQRTGAEVSADIDRIEREAQRLNDLIGQLLTLARLEGGTKPKEETPIDLAALVHEIVADAEFEAQSCKRRVRVLACQECATTGAPELLRSAIENIVRNGLRYTPEGSQTEVSVACEQHDGEPRAVVRVRDHGPGVPEASISDIFRPFYRVDDDRNRQTGGVGLGLAIAQQAIRVHGGEITAVNAPDGGLLVEIRLPATAGKGRLESFSAGDLQQPA